MLILIRISSQNKPGIKGNAMANNYNSKEKSISHYVGRTNELRLMSGVNLHMLDSPITIPNSPRSSKFGKHYLSFRPFNPRLHNEGRIAACAEQQKGCPAANRPEAIQRKTGSMPILQYGAQNLKLNKLINQYNEFDENNRFYSDLLDHLTILFEIKKEILSHFNIGNKFARIFSYFWKAENKEMLSLFSEVNMEIKDVIRQFLHGYDKEMIEFRKRGNKNYQPLINYFINRFLEIINEDSNYQYLSSDNKDLVINILKNRRMDEVMDNFIAETYNMPNLLRNIYTEFIDDDLMEDSKDENAKNEDEGRNAKMEIINRCILLIRDYCDRAIEIINRAGHKQEILDMPPPQEKESESRLRESIINGFAESLKYKIDLIDNVLRRATTHLKKSPDRYTDIMLIRDILNTLNGFIYPFEMCFGFTSQMDANDLEYQEEDSPRRILARAFSGHSPSSRMRDEDNRPMNASDLEYSLEELKKNK